MTDISDKAVQEALEHLDDAYGCPKCAAASATLQARIEADAKEKERLRLEPNRLHEVVVLASNEAMAERIKCNEARTEAAELRKLQGCPHLYVPGTPECESLLCINDQWIHCIRAREQVKR